MPNATEPDLRGQRIVIVGSSCAGKSSLAAELSALLAIPRIELDELYWGPDWNPKSGTEFRRLLAAATEGEAWVADGNYGTVRPLLWPRATMIIWLNLPFPLVLWRAFRRTLARSLSGQRLWHGNRESLRRAFLSRDSILLWVIKTFDRRRREFTALREGNAFSQLQWLELRRPAQVEQLLRAIEQSAYRPINSSARNPAS